MTQHIYISRFERNTFTFPRLIDHRRNPKLFFSTTILNSSEEKSFSRLKLNIFFFFLLISNNLVERKQSLMEIYVRKTFMFTIHIHQHRLAFTIQAAKIGVCQN